MYGLYQIVVFTIIDILNTMRSPFFILILAIVYLQYYQVEKGENQILEYKKPIILKLFTSTLFGILGGIISTVSFIYLGVVAIPQDYLYVLFVVIILSFFDTRFICFSYGASLVSLSSLIFGYPKVHISQMMALVAVLHLVESILILLDGWRNKQPGFFLKEDRIISGYNMNRFWIVPFVIFAGDGLIHPITLMAILGYRDYSVSIFSKRKAAETSFMLFIYSISLLYISKTTDKPYLGPIFALLGHEYIVLRNRIKENKAVLAVMGLKKGNP
ncbi:MAG: hypothetical protein WC983_08920 [Tissierellaceae bacterium]